MLKGDKSDTLLYVFILLPFYFLKGSTVYNKIILTLKYISDLDPRLRIKTT